MRYMRLRWFAHVKRKCERLATLGLGKVEVVQRRIRGGDSSKHDKPLTY